MSFIWTDGHITTGAPNRSVAQVGGYSRKQVPAADMEVLERCPDCGALPTETGYYAHQKGCLTVEVQAGRMTPRERQIERIEARERAEADWQNASVAERLDARMNQTMLASGKPPASLAISPGDLSELLKGGPPAGEYEHAYKGVKLIEDPYLEDGQVIDRLLVEDGELRRVLRPSWVDAEDHRDAIGQRVVARAAKVYGGMGVTARGTIANITLT